jgi:hypothetical protein
MAATLKLVETPVSLTYTGLGAMAGYSLIIRKDVTGMDVHEVRPAALVTNGQTWQTMKTELAARLI